MKDSAINVVYITRLDAVQYTMPTAVYNVWRQEEGKLVTALSDKVECDDAVTTITLSAPWFEICQRYSSVPVTVG
jgi:hypothetical protein